jgi:two-component system sensor histidine kinase BarA
MTKYGLRARVLAFTILPTLLIGMLLAGYFIFHRYQQIENFVIEQGTSVIEPVAIASEYAMSRSSREDLRRIINASHRRNSPLIKSIAVFSKDNNLFVTSNFHRDFMLMRLPDGQAIPENTSVEHAKDYIILRTPIFEETNISELAMNSSKPQILGYIALELNTDSSVIAQYRDSATAIFIVLIGVIISVIMGLNLVHVVIEPINRMVRAVYHIREGRLDTRVRGKMDGELDMLKNGINAMAKAISEYHNEMQQSIDQATSDLRETLEQIEIQNVELDMAKKRAQEAARIKSEFLANMSHELRTPLNGVIGFTRQLFKTKLNLNQQDYLTTIEHSARNLLSIINDILDFSKLEAGKLILENIPFNIRGMINDTLTLLAPSAHDKKLELSLTLNAPLPEMASGDPLRIQQIITNITGNAIKFTEQGMVNVHISSGYSASDAQTFQLNIRIRDTGIGMTDEQLMRLFQPFIQGDSSITRRYGGTGLGLVITQKLIEQMGGSMHVHSAPDRGSEFSITIPLVMVAEESAMPPEYQFLAGKSILISEPDMWSREGCTNLMNEWKCLPVFLDKDQHIDQASFYAILIGFAPDATEEQIQHTLHDYAQTYRYEKMIVMVNSGDPSLLDRIATHPRTFVLSKPLIHSKLLHVLLPSTQPTNQQQQLQLPTAPRRYPINVLAVDDNPANLKLIMALLGDLVQHVQACADGHQAVTLAEKTVYDVIFMDVQMPIMDGIQACQQIHSSTCNSQTPIIAVTAHASLGERERLMASGMNEYLAKPIDENQLKRLLDLFCNPESQRPLLAPVTIDQPAVKPTAPLTPTATKFINWTQALEKVKNNETLAQEMLSMLIDSFSAVIPDIQKVLAGTDQPQFVDVIHKLRGGAAYCGVTELFDRCTELEQGMRAGKPASDFEPELLELLDLMEGIREDSVLFLRTDTPSSTH